ncbi:hypothetical protein ColTof4_02732 [Colletotrichum tofieldiae]|uniref:Uncharacterized protein n=1 Tax=Colletotrichum tofieldiae TaxID=708197 RepID=A0A166XAV4_9PEZI|nr:hypothetical protein CT0861_03380 [Colletotrichum tofieldiae]GKT61634.1 hypothetical protein ColTof3_08973 [Colletotrichum tofieldiae]GKT70309.1 hypothetical protein ColTof4_02732 [Colletotrichum tofieldiae]
MAAEQTPRTAQPQATPDTSNYTTGPHATSAPPQIIERTNSWKPSFERRQSWNKEDQKRELQMSHIDDVKTGPGFTERA